MAHPDHLTLLFAFIVWSSSIIDAITMGYEDPVASEMFCNAWNKSAKWASERFL